MNLIKKLGTTQYLQSTSEIELFNTLKDKKIDASTFPSIIIYDTESFIQIKAKVTSKIWYNILFYTGNTLWLRAIGYFDYTTNSTEAYIILVGIDYGECASNPIVDVLCVATSRDDQLGNPIDGVIPSNIIQESVASLPTTTSSGSGLLLILGIGIGLYLISKQKS